MQIMETKEFELAEDYKCFVDKIFEIYHSANYGLGQGTTLWKVRGVFAKEDDTVRMHKAYIVLSNLMDNQYLTYATFDPSLVVLTQKGVDYISGDSPLELSVELNKYIDVDNASADEAFNRLWELIGDSSSSLFYLEKELIYEKIRTIKPSLPHELVLCGSGETATCDMLKKVLEDAVLSFDVSMWKELLELLSSSIEEEYSISKLANQYVEWRALNPVAIY